MDALMPVHEFLAVLHVLRFHGDNAVKRITVPMVQFVYLRSDVYRVIKSAFFGASELVQVFQLLDLVAAYDDLSFADEREKRACAAFAFLNNASVLQFLWSHGFFWDESTLFSAVCGKSNACFLFAAENDCTVTSLTHAELIAFVQRHGTPEMLATFSQ